MDEALLEGAAQNTPSAAANYVRRSAGAMLTRGQAGSRLKAERIALERWFERRGLILSALVRERLPPQVSAGAEHVVFHLDVAKRALKITHPNRFGHSVRSEGAAAGPLEYLNRLRLHNLVFGDDLRLVGMFRGDDHIQVVSSQPWIAGHPIIPAATQAEIDAFFSAIRFRRSELFAGAVYFSSEACLVAGDAHPGNVVFSAESRIVPIDVVLGEPGANLLQRLLAEEREQP